GLSVLLLVLSNSKTALALFVLLVAFMPIYRIVRLYYKLAVPVLSATLLLGSGVFIGILAQIESVVGAAGKDLTFSGRTDLWSIALTKIQERLWWGYGYGGFWRGWSGPSADVWFLEPWFPKHSHNGYLDLWLDVGLLGMVVFGLGLAFAFYRAIRRVSVTQTSEYLLPLAYLTFMLLYNLTESVWLLQNTFFWIFYVTTVCTRHAPQERDEPADPPPVQAEPGPRVLTSR
ncbi:MAG: O-antigen ligase, partial [Elainellaceae cyanobacterium]